jgi:anti-anti-sigma regulatory factor
MAALTELGRRTGQELVALVEDSADEIRVTSTLRGDHYTVVTVSGPIDARAISLLAAHFAGLLNAGTRQLVVDLSRAEGVDDDLLELMRKVETKLRALNGRLELTGLAPPVLYVMDDEPLADVFAQYRAAVEDARPPALLWMALRCPEGLADVPEPGSAARCRLFIDTGAHGRGERWGRRR